MVLSSWPRAPPPPPKLTASHKNRTESWCQSKRSRKVSPAGRKAARHVRRVIFCIAKILLQPRHDVRHFEPARLFRHGGQKAREGFPTFGDLHRLALGNPRSHARKTVSQIPDGCCFHSDTNVYHAVENVKAALTISNAKKVWIDSPSPVSSRVSCNSIPSRRGLARCG